MPSNSYNLNTTSVEKLLISFLQSRIVADLKDPNISGSYFGISFPAYTYFSFSIIHTFVGMNYTPVWQERLINFMHFVNKLSSL